MNVDTILAEARATLMCNSLLHTSMERGDLSPVVEDHDWWLYWGDRSFHLGKMSEADAKKAAVAKIST